MDNIVLDACSTHKSTACIPPSEGANWAGCESSERWINNLNSRTNTAKDTLVKVYLKILHNKKKQKGTENIKMKYIQAYLILMCFPLLCFIDIAFFTNWTFVTTLHQASLWASFFQEHLFTAYLCVTFL